MEAYASESVQVEQCTIGGSLTVPRLINGLWQLAGGHDTDIDINMAAEAMRPLYAAFDSMMSFGVY